MQQIEQTTRSGGTERRRVEAVVETLATLHSQGESLAEVAHDARNMVIRAGGFTVIFWKSRGFWPHSFFTMAANCGWWPPPAAGW